MIAAGVVNENKFILFLHHVINIFKTEILDSVE